MGYFSELDIKIRQYLPNYLDLRLPVCPGCGKKTHITGFVPERTLVLTCTACNRRVEHGIDLTSAARPAGQTRTRSKNISRNEGGIHGRHRSEGD